ncbi:hypothetical protein NP493_870g02026 [Ridgeia piscesae]|uniref:Uncharacterized protein n=1 Tax=Ridgeia piscesae TaxID=27915 RepID=A0AAD9KLV5_RIDPI|nr:hypothetical protein NP493_870g02026 [Ridgeia piscesae]
MIDGFPAAEPWRIRAFVQTRIQIRRRSNQHEISCHTAAVSMPVLRPCEWLSDGLCVSVMLTAQTTCH